ncbi:MAG: amino acid ABC transporter substrate-binding protein [Burkholderiales bacterium]
MKCAAIFIRMAMLALMVTQVAVGAEPDTLAKIRGSGVLVIGYRAGSVPFSYHPHPGAAPMGYSISICERIVTAVKSQLRLPNLRTQYLATTPEARASLLINGRIDMECGSAADAQSRSNDVDFSTVIFIAATRVLVQKGTPIKSLRDLNGQKLSVTQGTANEQIIEQFSREKKIAFDLVRGIDYEGSYANLRVGRANAVAMDDILLSGLMANAGDQGRFEFLEEILSREPYAIMLRKNDAAFKRIVDGSINEMIAQGVMAKLYLQWFRSPIPPKRVNLGLPFTADMAKVLKLLPE